MREGLLLLRRKIRYRIRVSWGMSTENFAEKTKQLVDYLTSEVPNWHKKKLPTGYMEELSILPDKDALELVTRFFMEEEWRYIWSSVVIMQNHPTAGKAITQEFLQPLGDRMDTWGRVDAFSAIAGPAWRERIIADDVVMGWTRSESRWWRRAALVCTVFLNRKAQGGRGDTPRTIAVCEVLAGDKDDMVAKGLSWALRDLSKRDREAVEKFIGEHEAVLPALVKREVRNKLTTGLKNPRRTG